MFGLDFLPCVLYSDDMVTYAASLGKGIAMYSVHFDTPSGSTYRRFATIAAAKAFAATVACWGIFEVE